MQIYNANIVDELENFHEILKQTGKKENFMYISKNILSTVFYERNTFLVINTPKFSKILNTFLVDQKLF
jgi:hypothetical protein